MQKYVSVVLFLQDSMGDILEINITINNVLIRFNEVIKRNNVLIDKITIIIS